MTVNDSEILVESSTSKTGNMTPIVEECQMDIDVVPDFPDIAQKTDSLQLDNKVTQKKYSTVTTSQKWKRRARDPGLFANVNEEFVPSFCGLKCPSDDVSLSVGEQKKRRISSHLLISSAPSHKSPTAVTVLQSRRSP